MPRQRRLDLRAAILFFLSKDGRLNFFRTL
jgi:hypothetical protein